MPQYFFIIGAQKGGTTALFEYLRYHPQVYMPPEKEAAFFTEGEPTPESWSDYCKRFLAHSELVEAVGTASPQYMCDASVPERMAAITPDAKLIAVLRDPIARAVSHYKMCRRRGDEQRSFAQAIEEQLKPRAMEAARSLSMHAIAEHDAYVAWGEYGRILDNFLAHFPREQLLILYSEDLREKREETLHRVCNHLGVDPDYAPPNLDRDFHVGGMKRKIPGLEKTMRSFIVRGLLRLVMSKRKYKSLQLALERWNVKSGKLPVPAQTCAMLEAHYDSDTAAVARLTGTQPPWFRYEKTGASTY
ncbi:MAG TPA: sulfotransferase [Gammaproteobacteria bacterium]|nr:sulfotransferase [Gammaproteobacteria bacterium]